MYKNIIDVFDESGKWIERWECVSEKNAFETFKWYAKNEKQYTVKWYRNI